jgi:acyl carrier protein
MMTTVISTLMRLVVEVTAGEVVPNPSDVGPDSIRRLGLNSVTTLSFLVAVEDALGIEWDDDVSSEVLGGFAAMAAYVTALSHAAV